MRIFSFLLFSTFCLVGLSQRDFSEVVIKATQITDQITMLEGSGGNIAVFTGDEGTLIVDNQFAGLTAKIKEAINQLGGDKVSYVLNTHWHGDHTGGNENFGNEGAIIISQANVRKRLSSDQVFKAFNRQVKASPKDAWPMMTFDESMQIHVNGESIQLIHVHNAHTDGDAFIYFPESNVLHLGDCFFNGRFPFIDIGSGGTLDGMIEAIKLALMISNSQTTIIPGHGALARKADLLSYYTMLETMKDRVVDALEDGLSLDEMKSANLGEGYEEWGKAFISLEKFVDIIWSDLERESE